MSKPTAFPRFFGVRDAALSDVIRQVRATLELDLRAAQDPYEAALESDQILYS
jgi:hypothetical protein